MRYEGSVYRPPSEAYSLIVQVTIGCAHNSCTFCSMFKDKKFRVRDVKEVFEDLDMARKYYKRVERAFLADGDALALSTDKLEMILDYAKKLFPECERVNVYGSPQDVLRKTPEELRLLKSKGVEIIYIGAESGSDKVLKDVCKGASRDEIIEAVRKIEDSGIKSSVTFISGLGGKAGWRDHGFSTGTMISQMSPSYASLLTLMTDPAAPLHGDIESGKFELLSAEEVVEETMLLLSNVDVGRNCVFRSNHASNYISLKGELPEDKGRMLKQLENAMNNPARLKDERFRKL
ncbi:MAG: B12-binding domain-containing radical SAM protein [Clostridiales bacterium]|nr:B12-binding domain-containing radical SAM protein [Clostridiales bacterium]